MSRLKKEKVELAENRKKYHRNIETIIYPVVPVTLLDANYHER